MTQTYDVNSMPMEVTDSLDNHYISKDVGDGDFSTASESIIGTYLFKFLSKMIM